MRSAANPAMFIRHILLSQYRASAHQLLVLLHINKATVTQWIIISNEFVTSYQQISNRWYMINYSGMMHTATYLNRVVITSRDDGVLHGVMQDSEDLRSGVSRPVVHQVGGG